MDMKDGDYIEHLFVCSSHDFLLFFSNRGKVYRSKVYELPEASRTAKGRALVNVLPLREGERIQSVLSTRDFTEAEVPRLRDDATARSRRPSSAPTTRRSRPTASSRSTSATTTSSSPCAASTPATRSSWSRSAGLAVRFAEAEARAMGRDTGGVRGMNVSGKGNEVLAMDVARDDQDLLVVTENGFGKRTRDRRVPQDHARREGRQDDQALTESARAASPARSSCASTRSSSSSPRRAWSSAPSVRGHPPARAARRRA